MNIILLKLPHEFNIFHDYNKNIINKQENDTDGDVLNLKYF